MMSTPSEKRLYENGILRELNLIDIIIIKMKKSVGTRSRNGIMY